MTRQVGYYILSGACLVGAAVMFSWFLQTAWLGSFPDRDKELYARWAYLQLAGSVAFLCVAVFALFKARKSQKSD